MSTTIDVSQISQSTDLGGGLHLNVLSRFDVADVRLEIPYGDMMHSILICNLGFRDDGIGDYLRAVTAFTVARTGRAPALSDPAIPTAWALAAATAYACSEPETGHTMETLFVALKSLGRMARPSIDVQRLMDDARERQRKATTLL